MVKYSRAQSSQGKFGVLGKDGLHRGRNRAPARFGIEFQGVT